MSSRSPADITVPSLTFLVAWSSQRRGMVCARCKASDRSPTGLFRPLPIPSRPWSHIEVDFVTGLPPSNGHSHSHDRGPFFYDGPLAKLPSATETANLLALHAFQLHGLPDDSDWGPQFTSGVLAFGTTCSMTSTHNPTDRRRGLTRT